MDAHITGKKRNTPFIPNTRLRYHRKMRQWTQADLASELHQLCDPNERERGIISVSMISGWERGEHLPSPFWQKKLCFLFATTPDDLGLLEKATSALQARSLPDTSSPQLSNPFSPVLDLSLHEKLAEYLQQQQKRLFEVLTSGSTYLRVSDIIGDHGLFVPPPWKGTFEPAAGEDLTQCLTELLYQQQHILLLGEAGQGKTTLLKRVFAQLADIFIRGLGESVLFPLYIPLRDISSFAGNALDLLWEQVSDDFPLNYADFTTLVRSRRMIFLFDGFDEIRGEITQQLVNERAACKVFGYPSLLSCRKSFFEFYLARSPLQELYAHRVELLSFSLTNPVKDSIATFCRQKQRRGDPQHVPSPERIIKVLETNQELRDLAQRPLLLLMILEVFTSVREMGGDQWTVNKLYRIYTEQWLKMEAAKPDSILRWSEKAVLLQDVAWHTYHTLSQHVTFTYDELASFIHGIKGRYPGKTEAQLLDDLCFRTLLSVSEGENYTFLHKSFQEYFVARYVFECMRRREPQAQTLEKIEQALQASLPFDVATFLKHLLKESSPYDKSLVATNLMHVYERNRTNEQRSITIRQQASHYLTSLGAETAIHFLEQVCAEEPDKWVQRGIMVGLAYYSGRAEMLDRYIRILHKDQEAAAINLGYHLIYYGDLAPESDYHIQKIEQCEKTLAALFRHLQNEDYQNGWTLDILTLSALLKQQGVSILMESQQNFLKTFFQQDHADRGEIFQQEKERLQTMIEGANVWS